MDHQITAGPLVGPVKSIGKAQIEGQVIAAVRIELIWADGVETLRGLKVALFQFRPQIAGIFADIVGPK